MHDQLNLDDRTFRELLHNARTSIVEHTKVWTDHNDHDPGITILEMLSWVTEMQQYYLNQVTVKSERRFLKLLGAVPRLAEPAVTQVVMTGAHLPRVIPRGTRMFAGRVVFETAETVVLTQVKLTAIGTWGEDGFQRHALDGIGQRALIYPFDRQPIINNALYLSFDCPLPVDSVISLFILQVQNYPVPCERIPSHNSTFVLPVDIEWSYYGVSGWEKVDVEEDETYSLTQSGKLRFRVGEMVSHSILELGANDFWLRAVVRAGTFHLVPQIKEITLNAIDVAQTDTQADIFERAFDSDLNHLVVDHNLARQGVVIFQEEISPGRWKDIDVEESESYVLETTDGAAALSYTGTDQPKHTRAVACTPDFALIRTVGSTSGLPSSRLRLPVAAVPNMILSIADEEVWEDWTLVDDFDASRPDDRHFIFDSENGELVFGNNEHGRYPARSELPNTRIIRYQTTLGAVGNIQAQQIELAWIGSGELSDEIGVTNIESGVGGRDAETVMDAKLRLRNEWLAPKAAITDADWVRLVTSTPGVRVARAQVLPMYHPALKGYPEKTAPSHLSIVVVPYAESAAPQPNAAFLETIRRHIEPNRLVTTVVHVIAPIYVTVTVHATLVVEPHAVKSEAVMLRALRRFLSSTSVHREGWPFGQTVHRGDIMNLLAKQADVVFVQDTVLEAYGDGVDKDADGDIRIPPSGLVVSGIHQLQLVSRLDT